MVRDVYPGSGFFPIPDPVVKKATDPGSGFATLMQCMRAFKYNSALVFASIFYLLCPLIMIEFL